MFGTSKPPANLIRKMLECEKKDKYQNEQNIKNNTIDLNESKEIKTPRRGRPPKLNKTKTPPKTSESKSPKSKSPKLVHQKQLKQETFMNNFNLNAW